jgi:hypothetical protein
MDKFPNWEFILQFAGSISTSSINVSSTVCYHFLDIPPTANFTHHSAPRLSTLPPRAVVEPVETTKGNVVAASLGLSLSKFQPLTRSASELCSPE